eukprot:scaffold50811_cov75-Phaeocystis_antarctica.AAC.2
MLALLAVATAFSPPPVFTDPLAASLPAAPAGTVRSFPDASMTMEQVQSWLWGSLEAEEDQEGEPEEIERSSRRALLALKAYKAMSSVGVVHAWVGQIVTFFAYRPPSAPQGSLTPTQPGRVTNPTQVHSGPPWEAPQAECWSLRREPKPPA